MINIAKTCLICKNNKVVVFDTINIINVVLLSIIAGINCEITIHHILYVLCYLLY